jgi:magnesium-transporting ATPase (P-type)
VLAVAAGDVDVPGGPDRSRRHNSWGCALLGLVAMNSPPREDAREAVLACRAGFRVMVTGDYPCTAVSIARELSILDGPAAPGDVVTGAELATLEGSARDVLAHRSLSGSGSPARMTSAAPVARSRNSTFRKFE